MDLSLIANVDNAIAKSEFLKEYRRNMESAYYNADSPLNAAQRRADSLMMTKQRVPMVIEYYKQKGEIESVEMYINPQRLNVQTQKVKNKTYTKGGIFYHHWGDDDWAMQLSGTVGLSGMRGIEQLEKIYHYSGTLLKYKNAGIDVINNGEQEDYFVINYDDPFATLDYILSNNIDEKKMREIRLAVANNINTGLNNNQKLLSDAKSAQIALQMMQGYENLVRLSKSTSKYSELYLELNSFMIRQNSINQYTNFEVVYQEAQKRVKSKFPEYNPQLQILVAFDLAQSLYNVSSNSDINFSILAILGNTLSQTQVQSGALNSTELYVNGTSNTHHELAKARIQIMKDYLEDIRHFNKNSLVSREDFASGYQDILDELEDEWRPRQVFVYFEDRVYIGHFDNFSWARVAESPLIQYDMKLTITRQIKVTSTSNNRRRPKPSEIGNRYEPITNTNNDKPHWMIRLENFNKQARNGDLSEARLEILRSKATYYFEVSTARNTGVPMSEERKTQITRWIEQIREATTINGKQLIPSNDNLYGTGLFTAQQYVYYLSLWPTQNVQEARDMAVREIKRIKNVVDKEIGNWTVNRKNEVKNWLLNVMDACKLYNDPNYISMAAMLNISN